MLDKSKLGNRFTCYECGTKFYDLNRPAALCPDCGADQTGAPVQDIRAILSPNTPVARPEPEEEAPKVEEPAEGADADADAEFDDDDADMDLGLDELDESEDDAGLLSEDLSESAEEL